MTYSESSNAEEVGARTYYHINDGGKETLNTSLRYGFLQKEKKNATMIQCLFIHGELKVVETNRKGLSREVESPASLLFKSKRELS